MKSSAPGEKGKTMGFEPAKCPEDCVFRTVLHGVLPMCGYLHITGELRGCDPGDGCQRYVGMNEQHMSYRHRGATWDVGIGRKMWSEGYSDTQIARKLGTNREAVAAYRRRNWGETKWSRKKGKKSNESESNA